MMISTISHSSSIHRPGIVHYGCGLHGRHAGPAEVQKPALRRHAVEQLDISARVEDHDQRRRHTRNRPQAEFLMRMIDTMGGSGHYEGRGKFFNFTV